MVRLVRPIDVDPDVAALRLVKRLHDVAVVVAASDRTQAGKLYAAATEWLHSRGVRVGQPVQQVTDREELLRAARQWRGKLLLINRGSSLLDDVTVSRRHVEFRRGPDGSFTVADVGSLNGTYVNRERIDQVALSNGDEVQIGKYRLVFYASQRGY